MFQELIRKLQKYEIRIRKAVVSGMNGDFHSVFKGSGLEFDDIRQYQYGDDVRSVNWNVTAKGEGVYINTYKEEKDQNVLFVVDISGSQYIGKENLQKVDFSKEVASVLTLSAVIEGSSVGLVCITDQLELIQKPSKGIQHAHFMIRSLYNVLPKSKKTNLNGTFLRLLQLLKRKSIVILLSDFIDTGFEKNFQLLCKKHDVVAIQVGDKREDVLPSLGIIPFLDKETGKTVWKNTSSKEFRNTFASQYREGREYMKELCRKNRANYLFLHTLDDFSQQEGEQYPPYVQKLVTLFKIRNRSSKKR